MKAITKASVKNLLKQNRIGLTLIFIILVILFFIFYLPSDVKELLILHRDYSNIYDLFTNHYVHEDFTNHLFPNMLTYLGAASSLYFTLSTLNEKRFFYKLFAFNCLIMPFILSLIWIPVNRLILTSFTRCYGFSGIAAAFLGLFIFAWMLLLHRKFAVNLTYAHFSATFLIALTFTLTYFKPTTAIIATTMLLLAFFIVFAYRTIKNIDPQAKNKLQEKIRNPTIANLIPPALYLLILVTIVILSLSLFPIQFIQNGITVNIFIHYAGLLLGMNTAQLIWQYSHGTS